MAVFTNSAARATVAEINAIFTWVKPKAEKTITLLLPDAVTVN